MEFISVWLFFNFIIRLLLESFIDLTLTSLLNLRKQNYKISGERIGSVFSFLVVIFLVLFSVQIFLITWNNKTNLMKKEVKTYL